MARSAMTKPRTAVLLPIMLVATLLLLFSRSTTARPTNSLSKRTTTKGQRKKGWRRRATTWESASARAHTTPGHSTIVTNPSTLGKGKGKGTTVTYTEEDENGRTTFVINCEEENGYRKAGSNVKAEKKTLKGEYKTGAATKTIPHDICEQGYDEGMTAGSGYGDDGADIVVPPPTTATPTDPPPPPPPPPPPADVAPMTTDPYAMCAVISAGNGPTDDKMVRVVVTMDVIHEIEEGPDQGTTGILSMMGVDLQDFVAPVIADCYDNDGSLSLSGSEPEVLFADMEKVTGSGTGEVDSGSSGSGSGYNTDTIVTNVDFDALSGENGGCTAEYQYIADEDPDVVCVLTTIPVDLYYDGDDTSDFEQRVQDAINAHGWAVPGLVETSPVHTGDVREIAAIETQEAIVTEPDKIGPAGFITIAMASLILALLALMLVRRRRREDLMKHVSLEDDDDTYMRDMEADSNGTPNRLARVVGEDADSVGTGWTGGGTAGAEGTDGFFSNTENRPSHQDVHVCGSATCEVCERNRQSGVQFIASGTTLAPAPSPPAEPREYSADDTVAL